MNRSWRHLALYLLVFSTLGTGVELVFLGHYQDAWQWAPIAMLGAGAVLGAVVTVRPSTVAVRGLRLLMGGYLLTGATGLYLHLKANVEFELELRPSIAGSELMWETLSGAIPALAPGAIAQIGLLGLLACYHHPALKPTDPEPARELRSET